ncbi:cytochrome c biogenesis CcdA family protein [Paraburkholderia ginsengisoli]|uniref:Cytochrome c biogenesis protein CcdA n=1 Tax=Paraburkholderia ginsengisoli TaxID=311231 RepID=A0A7T4N326_9BURK|nr:cytochrome c biogenesis CcdA family protein [Paraburkholderia ginsengisoli]QQC64312.1 cytochrome c biogenesis protein CcdA [Paraburkholderia ginsengisoli]
MQFGVLTYFFGLLAGMLSVLSPCVLPLVPILLTTAVGTHRFGPLALAGGLMISFGTIGTTLAAAGARVPLDQEAIRVFGAILLGLFGGIQLSRPLQVKFALAVSGVSSLGENLLSRVNGGGMSGQFVLGLVLGLVWSPCVGPTLGGAIALASHGHSLAQTAILMSLFGIGAGIPLIAIGFLSREYFQKRRGAALIVGNYGKTLMGVGLLTVSTLILTKTDTVIETILTNNLPNWLINISSQY